MALKLEPPPEASTPKTHLRKHIGAAHNCLNVAEGLSKAHAMPVIGASEQVGGELSIAANSRVMYKLENGKHSKSVQYDGRRARYTK